MATKAATKAAGAPFQKQVQKQEQKKMHQQRQETRRMVLAAAAACEDKKAEDIRILELDPVDSGFTDFFLIASGTNERQVQAIGDEIEMKMKREFGTYANSVEGRRQSEWILIDYVDFVVHIFSAEKRAFYDIERLRKSAKQIDLEQLKAALSEKTTEVRAAAAQKAATRKPTPEKPELRKPVKKVPVKKVPAKRALAKAAVRKTAVKKAAAVKKSPAGKKTAAKKAVKNV